MEEYISGAIQYSLMWDKVVNGKHHSLGVRVGTVIAAGIIALSIFTNKIIAEEPLSRIGGGTSFTKTSYYEARGVFGEGRFKLGDIYTNNKILELNMDNEKTDKNETASNVTGELSIPDGYDFSTYRCLVKGGFNSMEGIHSRQQSWSAGLNYPLGGFVPTASFNYGGGSVAGMNFTSSGYDLGIIYRQEVGSTDLGIGGTYGAQRQEFPGVISAWTWAVNVDLAWGPDKLDWIRDEGAFLIIKQYVYDALSEKDTTAKVTVRLKPGFVDAIEINAAGSSTTNYADNTIYTESSFGWKFVLKGILVGMEWTSSDYSGTGTRYMLGYRYEWE